MERHKHQGRRRPRRIAEGHRSLRGIDSNIRQEELWAFVKRPPSEWPWRTGLCLNRYFPPLTVDDIELQYNRQIARFGIVQAERAGVPP
jgi:hypothetical protein